MLEMKTVEYKRHTLSNTKWARRAIAEFVESNIPRFNGWLEQVAGGIPQVDQHGVVQLDPRGVPIWLVKPDPLAALKAVVEVAEYHLPKLSRSEATVVAQVENVRVEDLSTPALQRRLLIALGIDAVASGEAIEGEVIPAHHADQSKP